MPEITRLGRLVMADTLAPQQRKTSLAFKKACDFRAQQMLKHPTLSEFHSRAEHLHAGLLEGDPDVISYTPQPFLLRLHGKPYQPDCYVVRQHGLREVVELKKDGEMEDTRRIPLEQFFADQRMVFRVVDNRAVYARQLEAENWLEIVRILHLARDLDTHLAEQDLLDHWPAGESQYLGTLLERGDRARTYTVEIALLRLLHRGMLQADVANHRLDWDTRFALCA